MTGNKESKLLKYIALSQMKGLGPATQNALLTMCGNIDSCFAVSNEKLNMIDDLKLVGRNQIGKSRIDSFIRQREDRNLWIRTKEIIRLSDLSGIRVIVKEDREFPDRFRNISDMPVVIYVRGEQKLTNSNIQ